MAMIPCSMCSEGAITQTGGNCQACGGTGEIEAPAGFHMSVAHRIAMYRMLIDAIGKLDTLETKLNALQADMNTIKPQIAALYEDLNP